MKNEEQQSEKKKVHVDIEIYIIKIKEIISAIEYWYQYPFSIILLLLEFQKEINKGRIRNIFIRYIFKKNKRTNNKLYRKKRI